MIRKIIKIDESLCTGCGLCAEACHEGAIEIIDGKARLVRENFCDGFGDCLPGCPTGAITFEEREAPAYDEAAVAASKAEAISGHAASELSSWPCQIRLVSPLSPSLDGAHLLVAADCTAFAYAAFHRDFMRGRTVLVGCPKLDPVDYTEKLADIMSRREIKSVTVARMEVPCCGGLERAARAACPAGVPFRVVTISTRGEIL